VSLNYRISAEILRDVIDVLNYAFLDTLPIEFLYLDSVTQLLGGFIAYYMACYGLVTRFNPTSKWATRLSTYDGVEAVMVLVGTSLAPALFRKVSYYGVYAMRSFLMAMAILYTVFVVREHPSEASKEKHLLEQEKKKKPQSVSEFLSSILIDPIVDLYHVIFGHRRHKMRPLLMTGFFLMVLYYATINDYALNFSYLKLKFNIGPEEFAWVNVVATLGYVFSIFVLLPIMTQGLKLHETQVLTVVNVTASIASAMTAFAQTLFPGYMIPYFLSSIRGCNYGTGRALQTKGEITLFSLSVYLKL
jgi:hypothetical protein